MAEGLELAAVVLAAGAGTRLGGVAKALLQGGPPRHLGGSARRTFLSQIVASARDVGVTEIVVVVGPPHGDVVRAHARELGCRVAVNDQPQRGMASSVAVGFAALHASRCRAAWLWPVDHPDVSNATLRALIDALDSHAVARPVYRGRGGHPPLVARALWRDLAACAELPEGARTVFAGADRVDVEVDDPGVVRDIDTAADLEAR